MEDIQIIKKMDKRKRIRRKMMMIMVAEDCLNRLFKISRGGSRREDQCPLEKPDSTFESSIYDYF